MSQKLQFLSSGPSLKGSYQPQTQFFKKVKTNPRYEPGDQGRTGSKIFSGQKRIQGAPSGACLLGSVVGVTTPRPSRQIGEKPTSR